MAYHARNVADPKNGRFSKGPRRTSGPARRSDDWAEEGSQYRGRYAPQNFQKAQGRGPRGNRSGRDEEPSSRGNRSYDRRDRGDRRSYDDRRLQDNRRNSGFSPRDDRDGQAAPQSRSYLDYEHVSAKPQREENLPQENILAGRNPIREALKAGRDLEKLLVLSGELTGSAREIVQMARDARVPVQEVDRHRLDELAPHHQGMVAFASAYQYSTVADMLALAEEKNEQPFLILLDGVTDPHNLGAVIRTAECAGAHGVIVPERRSVGLTPAAVKASAGAVEHVKVARVPNLTRTIDQLKEKGIWSYAVTMDGQDYMSVNFHGPCALVIGSEGEGISRLVEEHCDTKVSLPMKGKIESLNASVAAGIMMYRVLTVRRS
ncbi:MAG: 23S rRNA (guanosine(2251)-2'-O)-methyltransferase RlmB [Clostridia bacterium]|nr:23S rRNA (guanosine(2251)-2'-O)-methyltransferase RlmB [Clostridia bacterium]